MRRLVAEPLPPRLPPPSLSSGPALLPAALPEDALLRIFALLDVRHLGICLRLQALAVDEDRRRRFLKGPAKVRVLRGHEGRVTCCGVSGQIVASGGLDKELFANNYIAMDIFLFVATSMEKYTAVI
eukprot:SM000068S20646  [mRNA]  locus=s68:520932:522775:- [translate_table: standard]